MTTAEFLEEWNFQSEYIKAHTSGSTSTPKDILLSKADMRVSAQATNAFFGIKSTSVLASPLSSDYIAGKMMIVRALEAKCNFIELNVGNTFEITENIDLLPVVPSQVPWLLKNPQYASKVKNLLIGGAPLDANSAKMLISAGYNAWLSYGMTETCSHVALAKLSEDPIYEALPGITFTTDSDSCLVITATQFSFGSLQTHDVVELISPTKFRWLGRSDNVINSAGLKLHPEVLEKMLYSFLKDRVFYLTSTSDGRWGEALTLVIEGDVPAQINDILDKAFPDHRLRPKYIVSKSAIQRTSSQKIIREKF